MGLLRSKRVNYYVFLVLIALLILFAGCSQNQQQGKTKVKGLTTEEIEKIEEPAIKVETEEGQTKEMKMEEYIAGVVAGEMKKDWPTDAYGAQAILARTFALKRLEQKGSNVISGSHKEAQAYRPQNITDEIKKAIEKTRGEVIIYNGDYITGWFHSSAGGQTTSAKVGLAYNKKEPPYIISVKSPDQHAPDDIKSWSVSFENNDILQVLKQVGVKNAQTVQDIKILDRDKTERAIDMEISYDGGKKKMKAANFRIAIGPDKLKSTLIKSIEKSGDKFTFKGSGYGHGVGMSQWGAFAMAKEGKSPEEIIAHYFKDVKIGKKWD
ncbi:SpoIID/LytB domain-containing protein [Selenihalanaerobacter shriftii]|uniref:Stage II sporulation protein D n=1 Tax=Selenihalanaerobacter shriftii TaxID=142842 RepID=A0A1T4N4L1_9FIRM|nr:SpoIID/LytB domain-containing protein [Selenihalanaerobacter shriftii]SJZ74056.1 stage II sporulation protein D [Selenihalanaerobacter shriftii]